MDKLPNSGGTHVSMIDLRTDGGLPMEWTTNPRLRTEIRALEMHEFKEDMRKVLMCRLQKTTPIPDEDIISLNLTDPNIIVESDFLAFELVEFSEFMKPSYELCNKSTFEQILIKEDRALDDASLHEAELILQSRFEPGLQKCSLVLISAGGGLGKSTQLMKLASSWFDGTSDILAHYDLVLYVDITNITSQQQSFVDILLDSGVFPKHYKRRPDEVQRIERILEDLQNSDKVLIMLDGYNKGSRRNKVISSIINGEQGYFQRATVVLAGRPYSIKNLQCSRMADIKVDIAGITDNGVTQLFQNILKSDELARKLQELCQEYYFDTTMLRIPLFAVLSCYVFHAHKAKNISVCQHEMPTTVTELFNTILRVFLKIMHRKLYGEQEKYDLGFIRSPLLDTETAMPKNTQRFLKAIAEMSYDAIKRGQCKFTKTDFNAVHIDPEEVSAFGLLVCETDNERCEQNLSESQKRTDYCFAFRNTMFHEYMAAMYMSKHLSSIDELLATYKQNQTRNQQRNSEDDGYGSMVSISSGGFNKRKHKPNKIMCRLKRIFTPKPCASTYSLQHCAAPRMPVEHPSTEPCSLMSMRAQSCTNLTVSRRPRNRPVEHDESRCDSYETYAKCLHDMLNPFQNCVMFACGMNPNFTRKLLHTFREHVQAKVCQKNSDKFDVGFESALYCESFDEALTTTFFEYLLGFRLRVGTDIQFPTPYDELVTSRLAFGLSNEQVLALLKAWYCLDLEKAQYSGITGGNIVSCGQNILEMNDPCLFEVYLLHRYTFENITELVITGNYFPNFNHITQSFPSLRRISFDSVNIPSMKHFRLLKKDSDLAGFEPCGCRYLEEITMKNCRASFPLSEHLLNFISSGSCNLRTLKLFGIKFNDCPEKLCTVLSRFSDLDTIWLRNSGLKYEEFSIPENNSPRTLGITLGRFKTLRDLDLSENVIGIFLPELLFSIGQPGNVLTSLQLSKCRITSHNCERLSEKLCHFGALQHLDISENHINEGAVGLIRSLVNCPQFRSLDMHRCGLRPEHFIRINVDLGKLEHLEYFDMSDNRLEGEAAGFLDRIPTGMKILTLRRCGIKLSEFGSGGAKVLKHLVHLQRVDLQENDLSDSLSDVFRGLYKARIEYLNVRKCRLRPNDFSEAAELIPKFKLLREFVIGFNTMHRPGYKSHKDSRDKMVAYLKENKALEKIVSCGMHGEHFTESQMRQLRDGGRVEVINFKCP